jgi:ADP-heptose:LPS heptosyltransferase
VAVSASRRDFAPVLLALRAAGLGDLLTAIPAWRGLARAFPGYRRIIATPAALAPIVTMLNAEHCEHAGLARLVCARPTVAVNLHGKGPQSHETLLATEPQALVAYAHPDVPASALGPVWDDEEHEVVRWCRLLGAFDIHTDAQELGLTATAEQLATADAIVGDVDDDNTTVIHPGAGSGARRWPIARYAAVARVERDAGRRVLVTGTTEERRRAARVAAGGRVPSRDVVAGRTDLNALIGIVAGAGRVICGDTGVAHLATALGTPSVVLFGPTRPARWGPPPSRAHIALWAGRNGNPHGRRVDPGLLEISVRDVVQALAQLPRRVVHASAS